MAGRCAAPTARLQAKGCNVCLPNAQIGPRTPAKLNCPNACLLLPLILLAGAAGAGREAGPQGVLGVEMGAGAGHPGKAVLLRTPSPAACPSAACTLRLPACLTLPACCPCLLAHQRFTLNRFSFVEAATPANECDIQHPGPKLPVLTPPTVGSPTPACLLSPCVRAGQPGRGWRDGGGAGAHPAAAGGVGQGRGAAEGGAGAVRRGGGR